MGSGNKSAAIYKAVYGLLFGAVLLCILIAVINPVKSLQLYPSPGVAAHLFADSVESAGKSTARWVNRDDSHYECDIAYGVPYPYCGLVIKYKKTDSKNYALPDYFEFGDAASVDLSDYDGVYISMDYTGPSNALNFFVRNSETPPASFAEYDKVPYVLVEFDPSKGEAFVDFTSMQIARWWADRYNPPQELRQPKFGHVFEMGIDLPAMPAEGSHKFKLNRILAKKSYFTQQQWMITLAGLAGLCVLVFIVQAIQTYLARRFIQENQTLRNAMAVDPLTLCLNRLGLDAAIGGVFPLSKSAGVFVMVLDLDHFKKINDSLGHAAGDEVLHKTAKVLAKELRSDDVFGRWGGEEFVIISSISRDNLNNLIGRLMQALHSIRIEGAPENYRVSMSIGITEAQVGEDFEEVFKRADEAMYQVKQAGRGSWKLV